MKDLNSLRKKIDTLDSEILKALSKRAKIAIEIGEIKKENKEKNNLFRPERQSFILKRLFQNNEKYLKQSHIFSIWRTIFFSQTELQGDLKVYVLRSATKKQLEDIITFFGPEKKLKYLRSNKEGFNILKKDSNSILFLDYPGTKKNSTWWKNKIFDRLYINAALPFVLKKNQKPSMVIISKNKPVIEDDQILFYKANKKNKLDNMKEIASTGKLLLLNSKQYIKTNKYKFIGSHPITLYR